MTKTWTLGGALSIVLLLGLGSIEARAQGFGGWFGTPVGTIGVVRPGSMHWFLTTPYGHCPAGFEWRQNSDGTPLCVAQFGLAGISDALLPGGYSGPTFRELGVLRMLEGRLYMQPFDAETCPPGFTNLGRLTSGARYCSKLTVVKPGMIPLTMDSRFRASIVGAYEPSTNRFWLPAPCRPGWTASGGACRFKWGSSDTVPYFHDFDGDGNDDLALYNRTSAQYDFLPSSLTCPDGSTNRPAVSGMPHCRVTGTSGQVAVVPGDYDADGIPDVIGYDVLQHRFSMVPSTTVCPSTFETRTTDAQRRITCLRTLGGSGDIAVSPAGDYDGDGRVDLVVVNQNTWVWMIAPSSGYCPSNTMAQFLSNRWVCTRQFGLPGDSTIY